MKLTTLGRLGVEGGRLKRQKPLLLLAYLAVEGVKPRRHLAELFFAQTSDPLNSLSRALSNLRKESEGLVEADSTRAWTAVGIGVVQFLGHADAGDLNECETLYGGAFAEDLNLELNTELEEWVLGTREYLAGRYRDILLRLGEARLKEKNPEEAARYGEKAYSLTGASELEPEHLIRVYHLLTAGQSPKAPEVREEAESFGIDLPLPSRSSDQAQETAHTLPLPKSSFVGRDPELLEIAEQLAHSECRLLTLHGTGGVGKSRLALQAAYEASETGQFKDGITFVPLDSLTSADLIPSSLAEALKLTLSGQDDTLTQVVRALNDTHSLIILDNFEHLMDGVTQIDRLLNACPNLKLIVTSRERLRLEQEWVLTLTGLTLPEDETEGLEQLQNYDAFNLFSQRAKRTRLDFALTNEDLPYALKICQLVDGYPLGIELSAVWVKLLPLQDIATEIEKNVDILTHGTRNALERHQSIRAVFEHSWKLLTKQEQDVLMKLSVFVGGFRREAAAEVADATLPILASLVDKSLLRVMPNGRYDRHPLLFQFMREKLETNTNGLKETEQKHAEFYRNLLEAQGNAIYTPQQPYILEKIDTEMSNIYEALPQFVSLDHPERTRLALNTPCQFLSIRGRAQEGAHLFERLLKLLKEEGEGSKNYQLLSAVWQKNVGWLYLVAGDILEAQRFSEQSLSTLAGLESPSEVAIVLRHFGNIYVNKKEMNRAEECYVKEMQIYKGMGNLRGIAGTLANFGIMYMQLGKLEIAEKYIAESVNLDRQIESLGGLASDLEILGNLYLMTNRLQKAEYAFRESLEIVESLGNVRLTPHVLNGLGQSLYKQGQLKNGRDLILDAFVQAKRFNNVRALILTSVSYAGLQINTGHYDVAEEFLVEAVSLAFRLDLRSEIFLCVAESAKLLYKQGNLVLALELTRFIEQTPEVPWFTRHEAMVVSDLCEHNQLSSSELPHSRLELLFRQFLQSSSVGSPVASSLITSD